MHTAAFARQLITNLDANLAAYAAELRAPSVPAEVPFLRAQVDGILDYRLVLMAARDASPAYSVPAIAA